MANGSLHSCPITGIQASTKNLPIGRDPISSFRRRHPPGFPSIDIATKLFKTTIRFSFILAGYTGKKIRELQLAPAPCDIRSAKTNEHDCCRTHSAKIQYRIASHSGDFFHPDLSWRLFQRRLTDLGGHRSTSIWDLRTIRFGEFLHHMR